MRPTTQATVWSPLTYFFLARASGLASGCLMRHPVAGGNGDGCGDALCDQARRRRDYLERAIQEATADKDMRRAEELYAIQATEFPEDDSYYAALSSCASGCRQLVFSTSISILFALLA